MFWIFDSGYFIFVLPALFFAMWAQIRVQNAFRHYSQVYVRDGRRAYEVALSLLRDAGLDEVTVEKVPGHLSDHYDPRTKTLRLSESTYASPSVAAIGIAAHEVGHAVQHGIGYAPLALRNGFVPIAQFTSTAAFPLFFLGFLGNMEILMNVGLLFFLGALAFQVITLPVEFNASKRALDMLQVSGFVSHSDLTAVGKVLNVAALTYVAAVAVSLGHFLRLLMLRERRR
jgi:Zn-dependent membrane protease YugP